MGTTNVILITLDAELRIEAGMEPVKISFPNIKNFPEDLNSGVVRVRTLYDSVVLDDSGTTEQGRKATTGLAAKFMAASSYSLTYFPTTESESATYEVKLIPTLSISEVAFLIVEYSHDFPYGLGGSVGCEVPLLTKADNDPVLCSVTGRKIRISNLKAYAVTTDGFLVRLKGVRNPNKGTYNNGIRVYVMQSETHA